jgi:hypothetical protein
VTVSFHGIKVHTEKDDLCSKAACPITGDFELNNAEPLPQFTPPVSNGFLTIGSAICTAVLFVLGRVDVTEPGNYCPLKVHIESVVIVTFTKNLDVSWSTDCLSCQKKFDETAPLSFALEREA